MGRFDNSLEFSTKQWIVWGCASAGLVVFELIWVPFELPNGDVKYGFWWDPPRGIDPSDRELVGNVDVPLHPKPGIRVRPWNGGNAANYFWIQHLCTAAVLLVAVVLHFKLEHR
jgi:hypothetical protein